MEARISITHHELTGLLSDLELRCPLLKASESIQAKSTCGEKESLEEDLDRNVSWKFSIAYVLIYQV